MNISYLKNMIKKGKIVREGEALFVLKKDGRLKALGGNETFDAYIKCLNVIKLEQRIAEIDERLADAEEAVISRRDEGLPTADAVEVVVELRRYRELNINKLKNYKKGLVMDEIVEIFGKRLKIVQDMDGGSDFCKKCAIEHICFNVIGAGIICKDAKGEVNRHFEEVND